MAENPLLKAGLLEMTVGIVANYIGANRVDRDSVPGLIQAVYTSLSNLGQEPAVSEDARMERLTPAQARKLITPAGIISQITQKPFKSMKRHISSHGYTPQSYREQFGLPADFPMVHPDYAKARSELAKSMGLGRGGRKAKVTGKPSRKRLAD
jgi:predicted transcriptional regulator